MFTSNLRLDQYLSFILLSIVFLLPTAFVSPIFSTKDSVTKLPPLSLPVLIKMHPIPVEKSFPSEGNSASSSALAALSPQSFSASLSAQAVIAIDVPSGAILLEKNKDQKLAPASTTKLLTALVARKLYPLDEVILLKEKPLNIGHTIGFAQGEKFLVRDILTALLVNSGNDAAEILAQHHPRGREAFMKEMNQLSVGLHLKESYFINPSGLDAAAHYSSAWDLSLVAREVMKDEFLRSLVGTEYAEITNQAQTHRYPLRNTNLLLGTEPGVVGIKTGTTDLAKEALVTQVEKDDKQILLVVLGSDDRYLDSKAVIEWVFNHYQWQQI